MDSVASLLEEINPHAAERKEAEYDQLRSNIYALNKALEETTDFYQQLLPTSAISPEQIKNFKRTKQEFITQYSIFYEKHFTKDPTKCTKHPMVEGMLANLRYTLQSLQDKNFEEQVKKLDTKNIRFIDTLEGFVNKLKNVQK
jgi:hypothetical protein